MFVLFLIFSTLRWHMKWKSLLLEDRDPFIMYIHYHCCWWPGDARSQGISNHGIDLVFPGPKRETAPVGLTIKEEHLCNRNIYRRRHPSISMTDISDVVLSGLGKAISTSEYALLDVKSYQSFSQRVLIKAFIKRYIIKTPNYHDAKFAINGGVSSDDKIDIKTTLVLYGYPGYKFVNKSVVLWYAEVHSSIRQHIVL